MCGSLKLVPKKRDESGDVLVQLPLSTAHLLLYRPLIIVKVDALAVGTRPVDFELTGLFFI
jgi:hypothetical protein